MRAVPSALDHLDARGRDLAANAIELARLGAWIVGAVHDQHGYSQLPKTIFVEVVVRRRRDVEPCPTTRANNCSPVVLAVLFGELARDTLSEGVGVVEHLQEEVP